MNEYKEELKEFIDDFFDDDCSKLILHLKNKKNIEVNKDKEEEISAYEHSVFIYSLGKTVILSYECIEYIECIHNSKEKHMISW